MEGVAHKLDAKERTDDVRLKDVMPFSKMLLNEQLRRGLHLAGFTYPTIIQAAAIPVGNSGMDLLVQSKSGTGKTLIFCCIVLQAYRPSIKDPQSLIIAPTREIAVQIEDVLNRIGKSCSGFKAVCVIGGMEVAEDRKRLQGAKAIVGTPGRLLHLINNDVLNTTMISTLVLDEADKMYTHSFRQDLERIRNALPARKQTVACSATFVDNLDKELAKIMKQPLLISTEDRATVLVGIKQFVYELPEQKTSILEMQLKLDALRHIFGRLAFKQCLIFASSQSRADSYCNYLEKDDWPCELISGAQNQTTRLENFRKFREFKTRILLATDLMSRGVDSENVNLVINLELPTDSVTYLHRIGRAGRFGSHGIAISFIASEKDKKTFTKLVTDITTGMSVLKFPKAGTEIEEDKQRDLWNFRSTEEDINYYGVYNADSVLLAPLASQDNASFSSSTMSTANNNKENLTDNLLTTQQSSIDTNTFLINSQDSAVNIPKMAKLNMDELKPEINIASPEDAATQADDVKANAQQQLPPLTPNPTENCPTPGPSLHSSSQNLITSNTIDDASSIAADSLRSSQADLSRYQSVLMQKAAIPTLVEFLIDPESSKDSNKEAAKKLHLDLFDEYTKEVLNNTETDSQLNDSTLEGPLLSSDKLAQLKSLLIDKPEAKSPHTPIIDLYSDFKNFNENEYDEDKSTSVSEDIDRQTFILSVATPSVHHDSLEELQINSSDIYPTSQQTADTTQSTQSSGTPKHFPSPAHQQTIMPQFPEVKSAKSSQKLSINKTSQLDIPPYQSPQNSASPIANAARPDMANNDTAEHSLATAHSSAYEGEIEQNSNYETEQSSNSDTVEHDDERNVAAAGVAAGNSSGFDEKASTSASSGIETSESEDDLTGTPKQEQPRRLYNEAAQYETSSTDEDSSDDEASSMDFFAYSKTYEEDDAEEIDASHSHSSNTITDSTQNTTYNNLYQSAYSRWTDLYWNQINLVQDYVKFFKYSSRQQQLN